MGIILITCRRWREGANWYWFIEQKIDQENGENVIYFRWSMDKEDIVEPNLIKSLQKQADEDIKKI